jgi:hypothetical protein
MYVNPCAHIIKTAYCKQQMDVVRAENLKQMKFMSIYFELHFFDLYRFYFFRVLTILLFCCFIFICYKIIIWGYLIVIILYMCMVYLEQFTLSIIFPFHYHSSPSLKQCLVGFIILSSCVIYAPCFHPLHTLVSFPFLLPYPVDPLIYIHVLLLLLSLS